MTKLDASLSIRQLELSLFLGWPEDERAKKQTVLLDIDVHFAKPPQACVSDKLDETVCYDTLSQTIRQHIGERHFRLVEHLSSDLYQCIKPVFPTDARITVRVTKHPAIEGLRAGVCFSYGDKP